MRTSNTARLAKVAAILSAIVILLVGQTAPASASLLTANGAIQGTITCQSAPVSGVVVSVSGPAPSTSTIWTGTTNASGQYSTDYILPPGTYTVRHFYNLGVCQFPVTVTQVTVSSGQVVTVNFSGDGCSELLANGGFETFDFWQVGPTPMPARYDATVARSGMRSMRSGILPSEPNLVSESSFYQAVTIPSNTASATLSFWYRPFAEGYATEAASSWEDVSWRGYSPEKTIMGQGLGSDKMLAQAEDPTSWYYYDWQEVLILDENYQLLEVLLRVLSNAGTGGWIHESFDLTPYKGRTINVYFNTINNGYGGRAWMYVDDVSLLSCVQPPSCSVTPTNSWVNLYGLNSTFHGQPLQPGQIVEAYGPTGVKAGCFVIRSAGRYGAMAVYGDDPATAQLDGLLPGQTIQLKVDGEPANPLGPDTPVWTENGALRHVELAVEGVVTRNVTLNAGWNLISFDVMPADQTITSVLAPISGRFDRVLGFTCAEGALSYYPSLPPEINTLKKMDPYHGYWIHMNSAATLPVIGPEVPNNAPLALCQGWNLISYLPNAPLSVTEALATIAGHYSVVLGFDQGALSFYTDLPPEMNTLKNMAPGFGYWVRTDAAATVIYPTASATLMSLAEENMRQIPGDITPTNRWMDVYSLGSPLPAGAVVEAFDPDGVKVGQFVLTEDGRFGPMPIYGDDPDTAEDEGASPGDRITFKVNGVNAVVKPRQVVWDGEYNLTQIDVYAKLRVMEPRPDH